MQTHEWYQRKQMRLETASWWNHTVMFLTKTKKFVYDHHFSGLLDNELVVDELRRRTKSTSSRCRRRRRSSSSCRSWSPSQTLFLANSLRVAILTWSASKDQDIFLGHSVGSKRLLISNWNRTITEIPSYQPTINAWKRWWRNRWWCPKHV